MPKIYNTAQEFRQAIRRNGLFKENRFIVSLVVPRSLLTRQFSSREYRKTTNLLARSISFPGRQLSTTETNFGASRTVAYRPLYTQADMTFLLSRDLRERALFEAWQSMITDPVSYLNTHYYKEYVGKITIYTVSDKISLTSAILNQIDALDDIRGDDAAYKKLEITSKIILEDAWPVTIGDMPLSAESQDSLAHMSVNFAFRKYTSKFYPQPGTIL